MGLFVVATVVLMMSIVVGAVVAIVVAPDVFVEFAHVLSWRWDQREWIHLSRNQYVVASIVVDITT